MGVVARARMGRKVSGRQVLETFVRLTKGPLKAFHQVKKILQASVKCL